MKSFIFISTLYAVLFSLNAEASQNATISYTGEFLSGTCDVGVNDGGADGTVTLPTVTADELNEKKIAGTTQFHFNLKNCDMLANKMVQVYFEGGSTVDTANYYLKNASGSAKGVELVLKTPGGNQIKPGTDTQAGGQNVLSGNYTTGNFSVSYITNSALGAATGGTVKSFVTYHLEYK
jgi:major type 1 subunit fimbrin (pilin)